MNYFFQALQAAGIISAWLVKATADGKISIQEMTDLVTQLALVFGFDVEIETGKIAPDIEPMPFNMRGIKPPM